MKHPGYLGSNGNKPYKQMEACRLHTCKHGFALPTESPYFDQRPASYRFCPEDLQRGSAYTDVFSRREYRKHLLAI